MADEGNGDATFDPSTGTYTAAAAQTSAGLQKWVLDGTSWQLAYTLSAGLNLGTPYTVRGYPTGDNAATGLPWAPATDGLRNITGQVNPNGTVTIWAITSTVSGGGDQGADPNKLVAITDPLAATAPGAREAFVTVRSAGYGEVLRGVSFAPGTRRAGEQPGRRAAPARPGAGTWRSGPRRAGPLRRESAGVGRGHRPSAAAGQELSSSTPPSAATTPMLCTGRSRSARTPRASNAVTTG